MQIALERGNHCFEWDHVRAGGEVFTVEVLLTVIEKEPKPIFHVVWRDITERKQREQAKRLEAVGRLAGGIAHDFNNLLVVILGNAEQLGEQLIAANLPEQTERLTEISEAGTRAAALTRQLLAFSKGRPIQSKPTDLVLLLSELGGMLRRLIGAQIDLDLDLQQGPITAVVDQSQIEQLVVNLAVNASDAMSQGGRLVIALEKFEYAKSSQLPHVPKGWYAAIRVTDTGDGMAPDQLKRAFEPFFTTKGPGAGTGLGLATVRSIAEQCGGGVIIESKIGKGTSVQALIPLSATQPVKKEKRATPPRSLEGNETILIAEDEAVVRSLVERALRSRGYRVIAVSNGAEALEYANKHLDEIDLLITDTVMPRLTGPELVEELQRLRPGLPTIFMSGYSGDSKAASTTLAEGVELFEKPFSLLEMLKRIRRVLDER
jgi:two-component system cell cycle sensor histidine kinase/response regulator CckA